MTNSTAPRIPAITPPYADNIQGSFDTVMPEGMPPLNIFRTVANNPRVLQRMVNGGLLDRGSISIQERELVILRTCARCNAEYEWGVHVAGFSHKTEFNDQQIGDTLKGNCDTNLWTNKHQLLFRLVDQLHETQTIDDKLWQQLAEHYANDQVIELIMLAGLYHAVSFMVNATGITNEEFAPTFND